MDLSKLFPHRVDASGEGLRIDVYLHQQFPDVSRSRWIKLLESGLLWVGSQKAKPSSKLKVGQEVIGHFEKIETASSKSIGPFQYRGPEVEILFEDSDLLVVNKPVGLTVHPGNGVDLSETLAGWLKAQQKISSDFSDWLSWDEEVVEQQRAGIVHRLDKVTSGVMVVAKNPELHQKLSEQFASREASRLYWAVIEGSVTTLQKRRPAKIDALLRKTPITLGLRMTPEGLGSLVSQLDRDPYDRTRFGVCHEGGRRALTHFCEISKSDQWSLIELKLETGRTHQIRVHLSFLGFPIYGDELYGGRHHSRVLLHAHTLSFRHPKTSKILSISAKWPKDDEAWLAKQGLAIETKGIDGWTDLKLTLAKLGQED